MPRKCEGGVIAEFCKHCEKTEIPSSFAFWTGIFATAECLGRACYVEQGHFTVWPNIYVVLVGGSAKVRKSTSIRMITKLLTKVEPHVKILSQKLTPEAMISALSGVDIKEKSTFIEEAVGCFINDELSTLIDRNTFSSALIPILTKLYDCDDFEYETKARGAEVVRNPCLSILGGSTLNWIREAIPVHAIGGGFTSRVVFCYRARADRRVPWPVKDPTAVEREKRIIHDFNEIRKLRGAFGVTDDAIELYSIEYEQFLDGIMSANPYLSGYAGRRHVTLLKTAMAISASRKDNREIDLKDMSAAIEALRLCEGGMDTVMRAITSEPCGEIAEHIMTMIMSVEAIYRQDLIREVRHKLNLKDLDAILAGLIESGYVVRVTLEGKDAYRYVNRKGE